MPGPAGSDHGRSRQMRIDVNGITLWFDVDGPALVPDGDQLRQRPTVVLVHGGDRKGTRLNSSHLGNSYAVDRYSPSFPTRRSFRSAPLRDALEAGKARHAWAGGERSREVSADADRRQRDHAVVRRGWAGARTRRRSAASASDRGPRTRWRSEGHTSELQSLRQLVRSRPIFTLFPYTTLLPICSATRCSRGWQGSTCLGRRGAITGGLGRCGSTSTGSRCGSTWMGRRSYPTAISCVSVRPWSSYTVEIGRAHV